MFILNGIAYAREAKKDLSVEAVRVFDDGIKKEKMEHLV